MPTRKTSIALGKLVGEHVAQQRRFEAMERFVTTFAPRHKLSEASRDAIEAEWKAPLKPVRARPSRLRRLRATPRA